MELLIFVLALCALALLAARFGFDSRASAWSKEAELSAHGVTWELHDGRPADLDSPEFVDMDVACLAEPPRQDQLARVSRVSARARSLARRR